METQSRSVITVYLHERGGGYSRHEAQLFKTASGTRVRFKCVLVGGRIRHGRRSPLQDVVTCKKRRTLAFNGEKFLPRVML